MVSPGLPMDDPHVALSSHSGSRQDYSKADADQGCQENGIQCSTDKEPDQDSVLLSKLVTSNEKKVSGNELETNNQTVLAHHFKRRDVAKYGIGLRHPSDSLVSERPLDSSIFQNWDEIPASYSAKDEGKL